MLSKAAEALTKTFFLVVLFVVGLGLVGYAVQQYFFPRIVIEWTTASELDTVGFNVLRAESEQGKTEKINPSMIPPADDPIAGGSYQFEDKSVKPGVTYYYFLEDVDAQGNTHRNGPQIVTASQDWLPVGGMGLLASLGALVGLVVSRKQVKIHE